MKKYNYLFLVSRRSQVERYLKYCREAKVNLKKITFISLTNWTGGDADDAINSNLKSVKLKKPFFLTGTAFGKYYIFFYCIILSYIKIVLNTFKKLDYNQKSIFFFDHYFSPIEFLALASQENLVRVFIHQHGINFKTQLKINSLRKIYELCTHQFFKFMHGLNPPNNHIKYIGLFYDLKALNHANENLKLNNSYLITNPFLSLFDKNVVIKKNKQTKIKNIGIISPGLFRFNKVFDHSIQLNILKNIIRIIKKKYPNSNFTIKFKPGEELCKNKVVRNFILKNKTKKKTFESYIKNLDICVCSSQSTTWIESLAKNKNTIIFRNRYLVKEFPIVAKLFTSLLKLYNSEVKKIHTSTYFIKSKDTFKICNFLMKKFNNNKNSKYISINNIFHLTDVNDKSLKKFN